MKNSRQKIILDIISNNSVETQNQLIDALQEKGVFSTQATISRDIKELRLVKQLMPDGNYRYAVSSNVAVAHNEKLQKIFKESVVSYASAQNLVVIKTLPGLANAACSAIDHMDIDGLVGTIAGDDTAFLAMKDTASAELLCREIKDYM